jgi:hypothetical protein
MITLLFQIHPHNTFKIKTHLVHYLSMLPGAIHAFPPGRTISLNVTQLACQDAVKVIQLLLGPFDASTHHQGREALLVYMNGILHQSEVNKGDLEDVVVKIAFEEDLTASFRDDITSCSEILFSGLVVEF